MASLWKAEAYRPQHAGVSVIFVNEVVDAVKLAATGADVEI
jgi:hypothetical protein